MRKPGDQAVTADEKYTLNTDFTPLATIRLETFRDGIEDVELLKLYEAKFGRHQTRKLLDSVYENPKTFTHKFDEIEKMRNKIFDRLDR